MVVFNLEMASSIPKVHLGLVQITYRYLLSLASRVQERVRPHIISLVHQILAYTYPCA